MKLPWFVSVNLIIVLAMTHVYHWAKSNYDEKDVLTAQVRTLTKKLKQQELKTALVKDEFFGFRQEIALNLPDFLKKNNSSSEGYAARSLASVTQKPTENEAAKNSLAQMAFEQARQAFTSKDFERSTVLLKKFINSYGFSPNSPNAYLLLVESLYQEGRTEESVEQIQKMVDMFPGHEVAGFSMIRLGKIMEERGKASDAIDIYKTVLRTFPQREVASQAKASLMGVEF